MSILTGPEIERIVTATKTAGRVNREHGWPEATFLPRIDIEAFDPAMCGPNSYDVRLGPTLLMYAVGRGSGEGSNWTAIDPDAPPDTISIPPTPDLMGRSCWRLAPGRLYLGATLERVACHGVVPWIDGRSSVGRLGVSVHVTAGRGDDGWPGPGREPAPFTLEITVVHPTILRPGMRLAQLTFMRTEGVRKPYAGRYGAESGPVASRFHADGGR